jgi:hypothetical protein
MRTMPLSKLATESRLRSGSAARVVNWLALLFAFACTVYVGHDVDRFRLYESQFGYEIASFYWSYVEHSLGILQVTEYVLGMLILLIALATLATLVLRARGLLSVGWPDAFVSFTNLLAAVVVCWCAVSITSQFASLYGRLFLAQSVGALYVAIPVLLAGVLFARAGILEEVDSHHR